MHKYPAIIIIFSIVLAGCSKDPDPDIHGKVIVLLYHRIVDGEATNIYERSVSDFEQDLKYLVKNDIKVISFDDLAEIAAAGRDLTYHAAIITFDDGDHSWLTLARPLLAKYKMDATFFLWVSKTGMNSFLSWDEIRLMSHYTDERGERPFTFASHTMSHHYLLDMKSAFIEPMEYAAYLDEELGSSRKLIENVAPEAVNILSLPFGNGAGDADIKAAAARNGYSFIRTSEQKAFYPEEIDLYRIPAVPMIDISDSGIIGTYLGI